VMRNPAPQPGYQRGGQYYYPPQPRGFW